MLEINPGSTAALLKEHNNITILCHRHPDGDTFGSGYALYYALKLLDKNVRVLSPDGYPELYQYIYGNYEPEDFDEEFVVAVDVASTGQLGKMEDEYGNRVNLNIDHHASDTGYAEKTLLRAEASSTCEIIYDVIKELGVPFTEEIWRCIFTGITTDTGCFRYTNTTPASLRIAADALETGLETEGIIREMFENKSPARIKLESTILSTIRFYCGGKCAVISYEGSFVDELGIDEFALEGISALPRQITGVDVGVTIRHRDGVCRVSVRTNSPADASAICAQFNGGGHKRAAGCTINGSIADAETMLVSVITRYISDI